MNRFQYVSLALLIATVFVVSPGYSDTVTLPASADTFIVSRFPDNNAGGNTWLDSGSDSFGGVRRGLLRFDLSSIPAGSTITSAVFRLTVYKVPPAGSVSTFDLYRMGAAWNEGNKAGANGLSASVGESTWNYRSNLVTAWTSPGALSDVVGGVSASAVVPAIVGSTVSWSSAGLVSDVQFWLQHTSSNYGWLLVCESEATPSSVIAFSAREDTINPGPALQIGYTPGGGGPNLPPSVTITNPAPASSFDAPATVLIQADARDSDGSVTNVQFFDNSGLLGAVSAPPFNFNASLFPGNHTLTAVAYDNLGASGTSAPVVITVGSVVIANPIAARIPKGNITVELQTIADGMASPLGMAVPDDGSGRMFVYDQDGHVWIIANNARLSTPLLDINNRLVQLATYDERGLLGLALHPNFAQNPLIYTYSSEPVGGQADFQNGVANDHQSVIAEWRISSGNPNAVDLASRREIMRIDEPQSNHNGGAMHFGPDGLLYVTLGDGGQANDVGNGHVAGGNAQDITRIWGKMIRIDVDGRNSGNGKYGIPPSNPFVGSNALPEIYAYGLRNPFSFSFDSADGRVWLADVGQNKIEEVDIITAGGNYGWNLREGAFWFDPSSGNVVTAPVRPPPPDLIDPIAQYDHDDGLAAIGGYVYHGAAIPGLTNKYVFGDWGSFNTPSGRLFYLDSNNTVTELRIGLEDRGLNVWLKGFGQANDGELYLFTTRSLGPSGNTGRMLKLVPAPSPISVGTIATVGGTNVSTSWTGGSGPFALQRKSTLTDQLWQNASIASASNTLISTNGPASFFRVADAAHIPHIPLTAWLSAANEHPTNTSNGTGFGIFFLDGNTLTFNVSYSGLTGPATLSHIHGPADTSVNASVLIDLAPYNGGSFDVSGTLSGVIILTDAQKAMLLGGKTYVNVHTAANPGGEIRGQIAPVNMAAALSGANEIPAVNTPASGLANLMLVGNQLTFNVTYRNLTGVATASHFHGPATVFQNASVMVGLDAYNGGSYGASGSLSGTVTLTAPQLAAMIDGLTYLNFHTALHAGGEMRGQVLPQVTGVPLTVLLSGLNERPNPLTNSAFGNGSLYLEGNTLTFNIVYGGLSGPATAAHFHGPADSTVATGVMIDLSPFNGGSFGSSGTVSGTATLTPLQRDTLLNGLAYVNFHTAANPGGEMRGQVAPVAYSAAINGVNEAPNPVGTTGSGSGTFALVRDKLSMAVTYRNLLSAATASHIHGRAGFFGSAGVLVDFGPFNGGAYGVSGALSGTASLPLNAVLAVVDGQTYINFHTTNNPGGEIRGQLMR